MFTQVFKIYLIEDLKNTYSKITSSSCYNTRLYKNLRLLKKIIDVLELPSEHDDLQSKPLRSDIFDLPASIYDNSHIILTIKSNKYTKDHIFGRTNSSINLIKEMRVIFEDLVFLNKELYIIIKKYMLYKFDIIQKVIKIDKDLHNNTITKLQQDLRNLHKDNFKWFYVYKNFTNEYEFNYLKEKYEKYNNELIIKKGKIYKYINIGN
jgi:hypothetical protein